MTAFLPALLAILFAAWCGTFHGGASAGAALAGDVVLLACALAAAPRLRDPLELGRGAEVLPWALLGVVIASTATSPVPRASLETLALLPAVVALPAAVAGWWSDATRRRNGQRSLALVGAGVSSWSLADAAVTGSWRAAVPLGHHGALAVWLLFLLPFAAATARERGAWRVAGVLASAACVAAIVATRSIAGAAFLVVQMAMLWRHSRARWWMVAGAAAVGTAASVRRLVSIVEGGDASLLARSAYWTAGAIGLRQRPSLGWGPGSVGWTIGEHLHAAPGRNPPGEVVSYLHFLPLDLAYQIGIAGALLASAAAAAFLIARRRESLGAEDPALLDAALASFLPGIGALCVAGFQPLRATVVAAAIAAGAALAATANRRAAPADRARRASRLIVLLYTACALGLLVPVRRAQHDYDLARIDPQPFERLDRAASEDAAFPLYAARRAWASIGDSSSDPRVGGEALRAAERAPGVAAFWLAAGMLGADAGSSWSASALRHACDLDPLGALAPFRLMTIERDPAAAAVAGARALVAEPRLAAALDWSGRPSLYLEAIELIRRWPGLAPAWRDRAAGVFASLSPARGANARRFSLELDGEASTSLSLFVFRRLPWPSELGSIELDADGLRAVAAIGSAALRPDSESWAFPKNGCGFAEPPLSDD